MDAAALRLLVDDISSGALSAEEGVRRLRRLPFADLGYARVDHHRAVRQNLPESVFGPGKTAEHCVAIIAELLAEEHGGPVVLSRGDAAAVRAVTGTHPGATVVGDPAVAGATVVWRPAPPRAETVLVVTAGTADLPVAQECLATLAAFGWTGKLITDVGVAGVHRLLVHVDDLAAADAVVVVAGMEGALASVVGGITPAPVVAVPTSVGYGASLAGVTALLGMLASCAAGLVVTGIDNGFGAAHAVARILGPVDVGPARPVPVGGP
ncbi:MAG: nickel pincer cofactor biosynthesis protein LarB [Actinomycetota bacterium]|nr:nickel pincer cofactor biosynthesis protein LarB [Actinomycetota bacterium]